LGLASCRSKIETSDKLLAQVYDDELYLSTVKEAINLKIKSSDSSEQIMGYINSWVRKKILEKTVNIETSKDNEITDLLEEYKSSLLLDKYERKLVMEELDTIVQNSEIINYYNDSKEHFKLTHPIFRLNFIQVEASQPRIDQFYTWLKNDNRKKVHTYCKEYASKYILDDSKWHKLSFLKLLMPEDLFDESRFTAGRMLQENKDGYEYFLKIIDRVDKNEFPPFKFIEDDIERIILQKRKLTLISQWKEKLFEREFLTDNVKIYL